MFGQKRKKELARQQALRQIEIMHDSIRLMRETVLPDTFFSRYALAVKCAQEAGALCKGEELGFTAEKARLRLTRDKTQLVNDFLLRCSKAGKLTFAKKDILKYRSSIPAESIKLLENLLKKEESAADAAEYVFCSVSFREGEKNYYYLAQGLPVCEGDLVAVPAGAENEEKTARVVRVERFSGAQVPVPPQHLKQVNRIIKEEPPRKTNQQEETETAQLREGLQELNAELRRITADLNAAMEAPPPEPAQKKETNRLRDAVLTAALMSAVSASKSKTKSRFCDGDCDNCPPHYGYRYGRWYYGHGHQRGCRRHGNGGRTIMMLGQ